MTEIPEDIPKMARSTVANICVNVALRLWRTDLQFKEWRYGPPKYGFRYGLAWELYHFGLWLSK